jgi:hypothetical protein
VKPPEKSVFFEKTLDNQAGFIILKIPKAPTTSEASQAGLEDYGRRLSSLLGLLLQYISLLYGVLTRFGSSRSDLWENKCCFV